MAHIGLISCVKNKRPSPERAMLLYDSPFFNKSCAFVAQQCDRWFILSARHGLVRPTDIIAPYDETLSGKSREEREVWTDRVWSALHQELQPGDRVTILAGQLYRAGLVPRLRKSGYHVTVPLEGLGIGNQLKWLSSHLTRSERDRDLERLYRTLRELEKGVGGKRLLAECSGRQGWPQRGVYLFFEPGECRVDSAEFRVVRAGTHGVSKGSKATLWNRLRTHRGTANGAGNHRSSIFRLHVGAALSARNPEIAVMSWGRTGVVDAAFREAELDLERRVSAYIGAMSVVCVAIEDDVGPSSDRAYIERNLIGLLVGSAGPVDPPSLHWLGRQSPDKRIGLSGLWNVDFLEHRYVPESLDVLEEYVRITLGKCPKPDGSIAPSNWYVAERQRIPQNQLSLWDDW